jgi:hypothetical protein
MQKDHRASKLQVEREKNELTQHVFQSQSLLTTMQGKSIKQEKEMAKLQVSTREGRRSMDEDKMIHLTSLPFIMIRTLLQAHLLKVTRDASRSSKVCMQISKPLAKNLEQGKKSTVKDAVVSGLEASVDALTAENLALRNALGELNKELGTVRSTVEQAHHKVSEVEELAQKKKKKDEATAATSAAMHMQSPGMLLATSLEGSSGGRSVAWISEQVAKDMASLRARTSRLHARCQETKSGLLPVETAVGDAAQSSSAAVTELNAALTESLVIIGEQDSLIMSAIRGQLPGMPSASLPSPVPAADSDPALQAILNAAPSDYSPQEPSLDDLLPQTSPETLTLLRDAGIVPTSLAGDLHEC